MKLGPNFNCHLNSFDVSYQAVLCLQEQIEKSPCSLEKMMHHGNYVDSIIKHWYRLSEDDGRCNSINQLNSLHQLSVGTL